MLGARKLRALNNRACGALATPLLLQDATLQIKGHQGAQKLVEYLSKGLMSMIVRKHYNNHNKESYCSLHKAKVIEKLEEKSNKMFHMISRLVH